MAVSKKVDYFLHPGSLPAVNEGILADVDVGIVYTTIEAMLGTTARSFWADSTEHAVAYSRITKGAASLLMDATDRLIHALWDLRGVDDLSQTPTPEGLYPLETTGTTIRELYVEAATSTIVLEDGFETVENRIEDVVTAIEALTAAQGEGWTSEEKLTLFTRIATIIASL